MWAFQQQLRKDILTDQPFCMLHQPSGCIASYNHLLFTYILYHYTVLMIHTDLSLSHRDMMPQHKWTVTPKLVWPDRKSTKTGPRTTLLPKLVRGNIFGGRPIFLL